jgi:hypothetical protein
VNPIERAVARPFPEIIVHRSMRGEIFWQLPPLAARSINITDRVEHLAHIRIALTPTRARWRDHRLDDSPFVHLAACAPRAGRPSTWQPPLRIGCHRQNHR